MQRRAITDLSSTQRRIAQPAGVSVLDHVWVSNPSTAVVYLTFWAEPAGGTGTPALAAADAIDVVAVASGYTGGIPMDLQLLATGALVVVASTAVDLSGTPSSALSISARFGAAGG